MKGTSATNQRFVMSCFLSFVRANTLVRCFNWFFGGTMRTGITVNTDFGNECGKIETEIMPWNYSVHFTPPDCSYF